MAEELRITLVDGGAPTALANKPPPVPPAPAPPTSQAPTPPPAGTPPAPVPTPPATPGPPPAPPTAPTPAGTPPAPPTPAPPTPPTPTGTPPAPTPTSGAAPPPAPPAQPASGASGAAAGGAMAAAGPAAAAMAIAMMVKAKIAESLAVAAQAGGRAGALDTGVMFDGLTKTVEQFGLLGMAAAGAANAVKQFSDGLSMTAKRLSAFSGPLAGAEAMANVAQIQGDIRRAQLLGPELSEFVTARSRLEQKGQDALAEAIKPLIPIATKAIEKLEELLAFVRETVDRVGKAYEEMPDWLKQTIDMVAPVLGVAMRYIAEIAKNTKKDMPQTDILIDELLNLSQDQINNLFAPDQRRTTPVPTEAPFGGPVFGGI